MTLSVGCPHCAAPVVQVGGGWTCVEHAEIEPLWRPTLSSYDAFADHLRASTALPTYLPWPISPGWQVSDFAVVGNDPERARATMTCSTGSSTLDGPVDVIVVGEEPGTGLGARIARTRIVGARHQDPGDEIGEGPPAVRVRIGSQVVPLWTVPTIADRGEWDRSVVVGEAHGRWLWLILRPASAVLLLRDDWILRDVSQVGPQLVEVPFGGPAPTW